MALFDGKQILITGGTGSLGSTLLRRLLSGEKGLPYRITVLSRDEAKQSALKQEYASSEKFKDIVQFRIGDVRDYHTVVSCMENVDIVFNAAALKQVPSCEYFPHEAVRTNIDGAENIVRAAQVTSPLFVVGISTDKACKPVNVMGMTKAIQERIFLSGQERCPGTTFLCVRYGNVLASTGSVIPLFKQQIRKGGPVTVTDGHMTRFLLTLDKAVDTVFEAVERGLNGEIYVPIIPSAAVIDIAHKIIGCRDIKVEFVGARPGEKTHEILVSEEEVSRTVLRGEYYVIRSVFTGATEYPALTREFSSQNAEMNYDALTCLLFDNGLLND
jgi:UDP-glucose 4-epimerase